MTPGSMPEVTGQGTAPSRLEMSAKFMPKWKVNKFSNLEVVATALFVSFVNTG